MSRFTRARTIPVGISLVALAAACVNACSSSDRGFPTDNQTLTPDSGTDDVDGGECLLQCSLDGRSVVRACTGEIVETCAAELACGAGQCQEPCKAAAADRSSNGCDFYFQPPLFIKEYGQSCYAAYVVNNSTTPLDLNLEFQGSALDLSKSLFRTVPGDATLVPQVGAIAPGDSAVLFVSDRDPTKPIPIGAHVAACPAGVTPVVLTDGLPDGTGIGSSFHLRTNVPASVAAMYPYGGAASFSPSATLLLPVPTWGTQHFIVNSWQRTTNSAYAGIEQPGAQIVASEDGTEITIRPTVAIEDGVNVVGTAAHVPTTYKLDKGQVLQFKQSEEMSGSVVSSNKPTSVFGGHACMTVPAGREACDTALQQLPAFEQWGSEYATVGYRPRLGNEHEAMPYRIVAARDGTRLEYDPVVPAGAPTTLSAGEVATFWSATGDAFVVRTQDVDHPIYLAAYMSGGGQASLTAPPDILGNQDMLGKGDPEFVNVVPAGQYLSSYSFYADPSFGDTSLVIVRAKTGSEFKDVWLECAGTLTGWKPIGTRGEYEYVRVDLAKDGGPGQSFDTGVCRNGLQRMHSDGQFTATLWGWDLYASYAYPGGMAQRKLVKTPLPIVH
ncbi:hypothetical protein AKJ09_09088 [Labilithrix luteola]|uniref:IgGFc-binding protein N-terminal domain-containing protein n=1 Tax=Labilithrix luteola TaxID=1391654 RepID=A0A0K1QAH7_9BACT|nr:IgGFc-binding protein [Labilithrix luteola]AKV02425.1 hypothetical protein AKJ09_09088 [Labilithrix luteola]